MPGGGKGTGVVWVGWVGGGTGKQVGRGDRFSLVVARVGFGGGWGDLEPGDTGGVDGHGGGGDGGEDDSGHGGPVEGGLGGWVVVVGVVRARDEDALEEGEGRPLCVPGWLAAAGGCPRGGRVDARCGSVRVVGSSAVRGSGTDTARLDSPWPQPKVTQLLRPVTPLFATLTRPCARHLCLRDV